MEKNYNPLDIMKNRHKNGFTIIELIVVVSVITLLASIVFANVNGYVKKARDSKRIADLHQVQIALAMYFSDHGAYPMTVCESAYFSAWPSWSSCWPTLLSPYISSMPVDPTNAATSTFTWYSYEGGYKSNGCNAPIYTGLGTDYVLEAHLENYVAGPNSCATPFSDQWDNPYVNYVVGP